MTVLTLTVSLLPLLLLKSAESPLARVVTQWQPRVVVPSPGSTSGPRTDARTTIRSDRIRSRLSRRSSSAPARIARAPSPWQSPAFMSSAASLAPLLSSSLPSERLHAAAPDLAFPEFGLATMPISVVPNWGAMKTSAEWSRSYSQMDASDFVPLPPYRLADLTVPLTSLTDNRTPDHVRLITAKYAYSTRYYGRYDLDSGEFEGKHGGIDIKLAFGTPIAAIGGGRVARIAETHDLGHYVMIEHHTDGETYFSIYGHTDASGIREGDDVVAGQIIGTVGMTGETASPHLHLQIDRDDGVRPHVPFESSVDVLSAAAATHTVNPIPFIQRHASI